MPAGLRGVAKKAEKWSQVRLLGLTQSKKIWVLHKAMTMI